MNNFSKYLMIELKLRFRVPIQLFFVFGFPIFLMIAFSVIFAKNNPSYLQENLGIIMMYAVLSASIASLSIEISKYNADQYYSMLERRGANKYVYLLAQILGFVLIVFLSSLVILAIAVVVYHYQLPRFGVVLLYYVKLYLYAIPFFLISIIIGFGVKNPAIASSLGLPIMFVSFFLSGMMIPFSQMTGIIRVISANFFLTQLLSALTETLTHHYLLQPNWLEILLSVAVILLLAIYTIRHRSFAKR
ncbi:ABC transporter permease [Lactococcus allomyrinae]|nr:ABC transporter permease [Lactococcus allomyrinae]